MIATFDCLHCEGPGTLESPICLTRVVENLSKQISVDAIVLADAVHRYYGEESAHLLQENARLLQQLGIAAERPPGGAAEKKSPCGSCDWRPNAFFGVLAGAAAEGLSMFHAKAGEAAGRAARGETPSKISACDDCLTRSFDDLRRTVEHTRALKSAATRGVIVSVGGPG